MKDSKFYTISKAEMIREINAILTRFYGASTKVTAKAERMSQEKWETIYQAAYLWRNDSIAEQIRIIEDHLAFQASF
jgi:hypothetical protein